MRDDCWDCELTFENNIGATCCCLTKEPLYQLCTKFECETNCSLVKIESEE